MKKILLTGGVLLISLAVMAGDGHNHGDDAFAASSGGSASHFDLTPIDQSNLDLKTDKVAMRPFYKTLSVPMSLQRHSFGGGTLEAQGFFMDGMDFSGVNVGQPVKITLDSMPDKTIRGTIAHMDNAMDPKTRLYTVCANVPAPHNWQGLKGEMVIYTAPQKDVLSVPLSAVQGEFGQYFVFEIKETHVEKRAVALGQKFGEYIEVLEGIAEGETVVTTGSYQLQYMAGSPQKDAVHPEEDSHVQHADETAEHKSEKQSDTHDEHDH